jgi:Tfp pilus assembly protein PilN
MQPLELNLASRPFRNNTLPWAGLALLAVALVASTWWNVTSWFSVEERLQARRATIEDVKTRFDRCDLRERKAEAALKKSDVSYLKVQAERANAVIARKALSWTRLFNILEKVQPYEVRMTRISPVFANASSDTIPKGAVPVSVKGFSREIRAFLEFERSLLFDPHFDRVEPEQSSLDKNGEVEFELSFLYYPGGVGNRPKPNVPSFFEDSGAPPPPPRPDAAALRASGGQREGR